MEGRGLIQKFEYKRARKRLSQHDKKAFSSKKPERKISLGSIQDSSLEMVLSQSQRQKHTHVLGGTGVGKSKFLEVLIRQDLMNRDTGLCLLDPHGSLYDSIVEYAAHMGLPGLEERIILFNPAEDLDYILGFNPIRQGEPTDYLLKDLLSSCLKVWGQEDINETPRISTWFPNILYPLIKNNLSFLEAPVLLDVNDNNYREILLQNIKDISVKNDWNKFLKQKDLRQRDSMIEGASNRFRRFLSNEIIRNIIGQTEVRLNLSEVVNDGKILLINLNEGGRINHEDTQLLGTMIISELFRVAKQRDHRDPNLKPFYLYIDEFSEYLTEDVARTLDQTRKFKVFAVLAHQHLGHLRKKENSTLYDSVMGNCKNKVIFGGISTEDAEIMANELYTGHIDLKTIKQELYRTRVAYKEQEKRSFTESENYSEASNWSSGTESSFSDGHSKGSSSSEDYSSSHTSGSTNQYHQQQVGRTSYNTNTGDSTGQSYSSGRSEQYNSSRTEGSSQSEGGSKSKTTGRSVTTSRDFSPYREEKELASREFWSRDDLMYGKTAEIKNQDIAEAVIKIENQEPVRCQIGYVQPIAYDSVYTPKRIDEFKKKVFLGHPQYYLPFHKAREQYIDRQKELFGEVAITYDNDIAYESYEQSQEEESDNADNGLL